MSCTFTVVFNIITLVINNLLPSSEQIFNPEPVKVNRFLSEISLGGILDIIKILEIFAAKKIL